MAISPTREARWFERGAQAFGAAAPRYAGQGYCCPICLGISRSIETFSLEHVPPESVGGQPLILTCGRCNGTAGHTVDWHWSNFSDVVGFLTGALPEPVTVNLTYEGLKVVAEVSNEDGGYLLKVVEKASNPDNIRQFQQMVKAAIDAGETPSAFNVQMHKSAYRERLVRVSVLRAAYLTGVAAAGYQAIRLWNPIRLQILDSQVEDSALSGLIRYEQDQPSDRRALAEIKNPRAMRCIYVGIGRWSVFLPLATDSILYRHRELAGRRIAFSGSAFEWPLEPSFGREWPKPETLAADGT